MSGVVKFSISLLIAIVVFSVLAVLVAVDRFQILETRFYVPRVERSIQARAARAAEIADVFHRTNIGWFREFSLDPAVVATFRINASEQILSQRRQALDGLEEELSSLDQVRIIDLTGDQLHYSSDPDDFQQSGNRREYFRPEVVSADETVSLADLAEYTEVPDTVPAGENLPAVEIVLDEGSNQFIYRVPAVDSNGLLQGTVLFYVNMRDLRTRLVRNAVIGTLDEVRVLNGSGLVVNVPVQFAAELLEVIASQWEEISASGARASLASSDGPTADSLRYDVFSSPTEYDGLVLYLEPSGSLEMPVALQYTLVGAVFLTVFLLAFLILNIRQDAVLVLEDRVKRFQVNLLREYMLDQSELDFDRWRSELEERRESANQEIRRGIGKLPPESEAQVDALFNKTWDDIIGVLSGRAQESGKQAIGESEIERIVQRVAQVLKATPLTVSAAQVVASQPPPQAEAGVVEDDLDEVETLDDAELLDDSGDTEPVLAEADSEEVQRRRAEYERLKSAASHDADSGQGGDELEDAEELDDVEEVDELGEVDELEDAEELDDVEEVDELGEVDELEDPEEIDEVDEIEEIGEFEDEPTVEDVELVPATDEDDADEIEPTEEMLRLRAEYESKSDAQSETDESSESDEIESIDPIEPGLEPELELELEPEEALEALDEPDDDDLVEDLEDTDEQDELELAEPLDESEDDNVGTQVPDSSTPLLTDVSLDSLDERAELEWLAASDGLPSVDESYPSRERQVPQQQRHVEPVNEIEEEPADLLDDEPAELLGAEDEEEELDAVELTVADDETVEMLQDLSEAEETEDAEEVEELLEEDDEEPAELLEADEEEEFETLEAADVSDAQGEPVEAEALLTERAAATTFGVGLFGFGRGTTVSVTRASSIQGQRYSVLNEHVPDGDGGDDASESSLPSPVLPVEDAEPLSPDEPEEVAELSPLSGDVPEDRESIVRISHDKSVSTADYEISSLSEVLNRLHVSKTIFAEQDGIVQIEREAYLGSAVGDDGRLQTLVDEVFGREENEGGSGIEELFGAGEDDLLDEFETESESDKSLPDISNRTAFFRFYDNGFDYDGFLRGFRDDEGGRLKSLVRFTRYFGARAGVILAEHPQEFAPELSIGIEGECRSNLRIAKSSTVSRNILDKGRVLLLLRPLREVEYFHDLCSQQQLSVFERTLFLPITYEGKAAYFCLGLQETVSSIDDAFRAVLPHIQARVVTVS